MSLVKDKKIYYYTTLTACYVTVVLISLTMGYKVVNFSHLIVTGSVFVFPLTFMFGDVIAEIFGYRSAKFVIWLALFCEFIFVIFSNMINYFPGHTTPAFQHAYKVIIPMFFRAYLSDFVTIFVSETINIFLISKWKFILKGKYYWLRSMGSTMVGVLTYSILASLISFVGIFNLHKIFYLALSCFLIKEAISLLLIIPSVLLVNHLKKIIGEYENNELNPFKNDVATVIMGN